MNRWTVLAVGMSVGVVLSIGICVVAAPAGPPAPARIGIVDFGRLLQNYARMKDAEKEITATQDGIREEAKKRQADVQQLQTKLQMHTPGSDAYTNTQKEITTKSVEFETWTKLKAGELLDRERNSIRDIYTDVEKAAGDYAKANGFTLVLKTDRLDMTSPSVRELDFRVTLKQILYSSEEMDITDALAAMVNARYEKQKTLEGAVKDKGK